MIFGHLLDIFCGKQCWTSQSRECVWSGSLKLFTGSSWLHLRHFKMYSEHTKCTVYARLVLLLQGQPINSYQMDIWHKVAQHSCGNSKRPHTVSDDMKHPQVEVLPGHSQGFIPPARPLTSRPWLGWRFARARTHTRRSHAAPSR